MSQLLVLFCVHLHVQVFADMPKLIDDLRSGDEQVRLAAVKRASQLEGQIPQKAIEELIKLLGNSRSAVREHVIEALEKASPYSDNALYALIEGLDRSDVSWSAELALLRIGKPAIKPIVATLKSNKTSPPRILLYGLLADMREHAKDAIPALEEGLKSDDEKERFHAARAIIEITPANKSVHGILCAALRDPQMRIRLVAAESLAKSPFKSKDVLRALLGMLGDEKVTENQFYRAAVSLARFGPLGKEALPELAMQFEKMITLKNSSGGTFIAGAMIKIDPKNQDAKAFLVRNRGYLQRLGEPSSDRVFREFAKDILETVLAPLEPTLKK